MRVSKSARIGLRFVGLIGLAAFLIWRVFLVGEAGSSKRAREAALRTDLQFMRNAIDNYTAAKERPPASLQELVDADGIREIPTDPITVKKDWVIVMGEVEVSPGQKVIGITNIHSRSTRMSSEGTAYDTW